MAVPHERRLDDKPIIQSWNNRSNATASLGLSRLFYLTEGKEGDRKDKAEDSRAAVFFNTCFESSALYQG